MSFESDPQKSDVRQGVRLRWKVDQLVLLNIDQAYEVARSIKHPWYRCQSLAKISEHTNRTLMAPTLKESFESALMCHDENRRVVVACWPLSVAIRKNYRELAKSILQECIQQLGRDKDPISTWCAVSILNTVKKDKELVGSFCDAFILATSRGHGWRVERSIRKLLDDPDVLQHSRYVEHLRQRMNEIQNWKDNHRSTKSR